MSSSWFCRVEAKVKLPCSPTCGHRSKSIHLLLLLFFAALLLSSNDGESSSVRHFACNFRNAIACFLPISLLITTSRYLSSYKLREREFVPSLFLFCARFEDGMRPESRIDQSHEQECNELHKSDLASNHIKGVVVSASYHRINLFQNSSYMGCFPSKPSSNIRVFGIALNSVPRHQSNPLVPRIVVECAQFLEHPKHVCAEGLYRISGSHKDIKALQEKVHQPSLIYFLHIVYGFRFPHKQIDRLSDYDAINSYDEHTVAGVLKAFFRGCKSNFMQVNINDLDGENGSYLPDS